VAEEMKKSGWGSDPDDLSGMRVRRDSPTSGARDAFLELKNRMSDQIQAQLDPGLDRSQASQIRLFVNNRLDAMLEEGGIVLNRGERRQLVEAIVADLVSPQP
jgi:hypothetical protein